MTQDKNPKRYDLEERTLTFAKEVMAFTKTLPRTTANVEVIKQLIRSSGSVGANDMIPLKKRCRMLPAGGLGVSPRFKSPPRLGDLGG
ncbi:MAG: four helix bundle protein [Dehalococcoidia bacterium]